MKIEFSSKVYIGRKGAGRLLRFLLLLAGGVILFVVVIKMLADDLRIADYGGILFSVFLIWSANRSARGAPQYAYADGEIEFGEDRLTIRYRNTGTGEADRGRRNTTVLLYREIKSIEYGEALHCYRFVTGDGPEDDRTETLMYVLDEEEEQVIRKHIRRYTGFLVRVMEDSTD